MFTSKRSVVIGAVVGVLFVAGAAALWFFTPRPIAARPLDRVPSDALAVLWVDAQPVIHSKLWKSLDARGSSEGARLVESTCGFNPLDLLTDVTVFTGKEEIHALDHLAVVARGKFDQKRLGECVSKVVGANGASTLHKVQIEGVDALAGNGKSRAAFVGSDGLVAGEEDVVRDAIRVLHAKRATASTNAVLTGLWKDVSTGRQVVLVAKVPATWRAPLVRSAARAGSGLGDAIGNIQAVGVGATLSPGVSAGVVVKTLTPANATQLTQAIKSGVDSLLANPGVALTPVGTALRRVQVDTNGDRAILTVDLGDTLFDEVVNTIRTIAKVRLE